MSVLAGFRILVVEDEALVALSLEDALYEAGAEVIGPAAEVSAALILLRHHEPAAAVLDLNLNGTFSFPVAQALAERHIPFVIASGYGDTYRHLLPASAATLSKPYSPLDIVDVLARTLCLPCG